jgi:hypothetical protein
MPPADSFNQFNRGHRRLKVEPRFFDDLVNGKKSFEVRLDDRNFKFGDILHLWEWGSSGLPGEGGFTGREVTRQIKHILKGGRYGIEPASSSPIWRGFSLPLVAIW